MTISQNNIKPLSDFPNNPLILVAPQYLYILINTGNQSGLPVWLELKADYPKLQLNPELLQIFAVM